MHLMQTELLFPDMVLPNPGNGFFWGFGVNLVGLYLSSYQALSKTIDDDVFFALLENSGNFRLGTW